MLTFNVVFLPPEGERAKCHKSLWTKGRLGYWFARWLSRIHTQTNLLTSLFLPRQGWGSKTKHLALEAIRKTQGAISIGSTAKEMEFLK